MKSRRDCTSHRAPPQALATTSPPQSLSTPPWRRRPAFQPHNFNRHKKTKKSAKFMNPSPLSSNAVTTKYTKHTKLLHCSMISSFFTAFPFVYFVYFVKKNPFASIKNPILRFLPLLLSMKLFFTTGDKNNEGRTRQSLPDSCDQPQITTQTKLLIPPLVIFAFFCGQESSAPRTMSAFS